MTATHYPPSLSGPRERKLDLDCKRCHGVGAARVNCRECGEPVCYSCLVACASCAAMDEGEPLGGIPLLAKEVETPKRLILDPGEVVRFDALAEHPHDNSLRLGTWEDTAIVHRLCTISVSQSAFLKIASVANGRIEGFSVTIERGRRATLTDRILLNYPAEVYR